MAIADAEAADGFEDPRAGRHHVRQGPVGGQHGQHLPGPGRDDQADARMHLAPFQESGHAHHVGIRRVRAAPDGHLVHREPGQRLDGRHLVGSVRLGGKRHDGSQVELERLLAAGTFVRRQLAPGRAAPLGLEERAGDSIAREDRGRHAQFGAHVGDRGALRHAEAGQAGARVFQHTPRVALGRKAAQQMQDHVLGRAPGPQRAGQKHPYDARVLDVKRRARQGQRHVNAARAHGQHPHPAAGRRVRVRAQQGLAGRRKPLEVHLVADSVAGPRKENAVARRHGLQVGMIVGVFVAVLDGVMVHVADREFRGHPRQAHTLELQVDHGAGGVLGQGLVNLQPDFPARFEIAFHPVRVHQLFGHTQFHQASSQSVAASAHAARPRAPARDTPAPS